MTTETIKLRVLNLGAGVQSTTLALMAAHGEIGPMPDCAIFADTGAEPKAVYKHLDWLMSGNMLPFPVHVVSAGNLRDEILSAARGDGPCWGRVPFFVASKRRGASMVRRQCTGDYKIDPIHRKTRELIGLKPRQRAPKEVTVEQWIGISLDEIIRCKPARQLWIKNRWPLVEQRMKRWDCIQWLKAHEYPVPPKSSCTFCPYHSDAEWRRLRDEDPESWNDAVAVDRAIAGGVKSVKGLPFLHRSLRRLEDVDLSTAEDKGQIPLWFGECEGMCGV